MPSLGSTELLIIAGVLVLLFGAAKLPKLARSLGESARIFKAETKGIGNEDSDDDADGGKDGKAAGRDDAVKTRELPQAEQHRPQVAEMVSGHEAGDRRAS